MKCSEWQQGRMTNKFCPADLPQQKKSKTNKKHNT